MKIRKTTPADLPAVMDIYHRAQLRMAAEGNPHQWGVAHPPQALIEADIAAGHSYVCEDTPGRVGAVFYWCVADDPTYASINGAWAAPGPYGVVHRIARHEEAKGAGAFCLEWCFAQHPNVRIDTFKDNRAMLVMLQRLGYVYCGVIRLGVCDDPAMDERLAFQKV